MPQDFEKEINEFDELFPEVSEEPAKFKIEESRDTIFSRRHFFPENAWIVTYADLMTTLMIFFMILYGYGSLIKSSRYEKTMASIQRQMGGDETQLQKILTKEKEADAANRMEDYIKEKNLADFANVETNAQRVKISLSNPILFELGSSDLKDEALPALKEIANLIRSMPNSVVVEGHTDNLSVSGRKYRSNFELSAARAFSVIRYFIENENISPQRFSTFGYGEFMPKQQNDSEEHRAMNRRIEINIIRQQG